MCIEFIRLTLLAVRYYKRLMIKFHFRAIAPVFLFMILLPGITAADSSSQWNERINKNGITVWTKPVVGYEVDSYRAQSDLDFSIEDVYAHLTDFQNSAEWVQNCKEFEVIIDKENKETGFWEYYVVISPPFSKDRDNVVQVTSLPPSNDGTAFIEHKAVLSDRPERRRTVRITDYNETWHLIKLSDTKTRATLEVRFDPGGNPPTKVLNWMVAQGPYEVFETMIGHLGE